MPNHHVKSEEPMIKVEPSSEDQQTKNVLVEKTENMNVVKSERTGDDNADISKKSTPSKRRERSRSKAPHSSRNSGTDSNDGIPDNFFDDFSNNEFMAGLDILDSWDANRDREDEPHSSHPSREGSFERSRQNSPRSVEGRRSPFYRFRRVSNVGSMRPSYREQNNRYREDRPYGRHSPYSSRGYSGRRDRSPLYQRHRSPVDRFNRRSPPRREYRPRYREEERSRPENSRERSLRRHSRECSENRRVQELQFVRETSSPVYTPITVEKTVEVASSGLCPPGMEDELVEEGKSSRPNSVSGSISARDRARYSRDRSERESHGSSVFCEKDRRSVDRLERQSPGRQFHRNAASRDSRRSRPTKRFDRSSPASNESDREKWLTGFDRSQMHGAYPKSTSRRSVSPKRRKRSPFLHELARTLCDVQPVPAPNVSHFVHPNYGPPLMQQHPAMTTPGQMCMPAFNNFNSMPTMPHFGGSAPPVSWQMNIGPGHGVTMNEPVFPMSNMGVSMSSDMGNMPSDMVNPSNISTYPVPVPPVDPPGFCAVVPVQTESALSYNTRGTSNFKPMDVEKPPTTNISKLFQDKKISLTDFLTVSAKGETEHSNIPTASNLQKKIKVISRCQDAIKALAGETKLSSRFFPKMHQFIENEVERPVYGKWRSPLRRLPAARFRFTTPTKHTESGIKNAMRKLLSSIGLAQPTAAPVKSIKAAATSNVQSSVRPSISGTVTTASVCSGSTAAVTHVHDYQHVCIQTEPSICQLCEIRSVRQYAESSTQTEPKTQDEAIQVNPDELPPAKVVLRSILKGSLSYLTAAQLRQKEVPDHDDAGAPHLKPSSSSSSGNAVFADAGGGGRPMPVESEEVLFNPFNGTRSIVPSVDPSAMRDPWAQTPWPDFESRRFANNKRNRRKKAKQRLQDYGNLVTTNTAPKQNQN